MKPLRIAALLILVAAPLSAQGEPADTITGGDSAQSIRSLWARSADASGLTISSTRTYNRVEGLGIYFGPVYRDSGERASVNVSLAGILRTADGFRWDSGNIGHDASISLRGGPERRYGVGAQLYDIVDAVERWQLDDPEAGLAALVFHRDYRDWFGRHGASLNGTIFVGLRSFMTLRLRNERWSSRDSRDVFSVNRNGEAWRENPRVNDGRVRLLDLGLRIDTRNEASRPSSGILAAVEFEHGDARLEAPGERSRYGRVLIDARRYTRLSPGEQVNVRVVLGAGAYGDQLPLQRRFSVGGVGTIPGFDYRRRTSSSDVAQCSAGLPPPGNPAQCTRVVLAQVEYRSQIAPDLFDRFRPRIGRFQLNTLKPAVIAFADAGRGWPASGRFMTDVGVGIDLGIAGVYVAKAVSAPKEPANIFVRIRSRY